ncbi:MAG: alpha/beta fold hydrolase [Acidobacteria bacterium]|nr:alpha/beta fold hydrolase [Acidobacteriota bacterium]MBV9478782.1 alpha/beta fold hydrolase [Acidobacteriota bacterium]
MHYLTDGPERAKHRFLFAHGAGGPMDRPFMNAIARGLAAEGIRVVRFEFPYMAARREGGKRGSPDRPQVLLDTWRRVIDEHGGGARVAIGGASMGGRIASMIADDAGVRGLVCFGYPFHPPGRPAQLRTAHLETLRTRALIIQGTRDPFGGPDEVASYPLSRSIRVEWLEDGDHSFKPRKSSGFTEADHLARAVMLAAPFLTALG